MRVVHLVTSLHMGGISTLLYHLLPRLSAEGVENVVICFQARGEMAEPLEARGIKVETCLAHGTMEVPFSYRVGKCLRRSLITTFGPRLASRIHRSQAQVVHSHAHGKLWLTQLLAARVSGVPFAMTLHSPSSSYPASFLGRRVFPQLLGPGDRIVPLGPSVTESLGSWVQRLPGGALAFGAEGLPNGIPDPGPTDREQKAAARAALGIPLDAFVVGGLGRLISMKRYDDLLKATARLVHREQSSQPVFSILIGDGSARRELESIAANLGLEERVRFLGFRRHPERWLRALDVYVLPSLFEGLGLATIEAMACGLPVVATDVQGTRELVLDEKSGFLVPVENPEALENGIRRLMEDPGLRERFGRVGRSKFLERFEISRCTERHLELYSEMVKRKKIEELA